MTKKWKTRLALMWLWLTMIGICAVPVGIYFYVTLSNSRNDEINHALGAMWLQENMNAVVVVSWAFILWTGYIVWVCRRGEQNAVLREAVENPAESYRQQCLRDRKPVVRLSDARKIVSDYGQLMEREGAVDTSEWTAIATTVYLQVAPISSLPHPKWKIKQALQLCFVAEPNLSEIRNAIAFCFTHLARYVPDDEAWEAHEEGTEDTIPAILERVEADRDRLAAELFSFLVELEDVIPEAVGLIDEYNHEV